MQLTPALQTESSTADDPVLTLALWLTRALAGAANQAAGQQGTDSTNLSSKGEDQLRGQEHKPQPRATEVPVTPPSTQQQQQQQQEEEEEQQEASNSQDRQQPHAPKTPEGGLLQQQQQQHPAEALRQLLDVLLSALQYRHALSMQE